MMGCGLLWGYYGVIMGCVGLRWAVGYYGVIMGCGLQWLCVTVGLLWAVCHYGVIVGSLLGHYGVSLWGVIMGCYYGMPLWGGIMGWHYGVSL